jgi:hypothetical protein
MDINKLCLYLKETALKLGVKFILNETIQVSNIHTCKADNNNNSTFDNNHSSNSNSAANNNIHYSNKYISKDDDNKIIDYITLSNNKRIKSSIYVITTGNYSNLFAEWANDCWHSWPIRGIAMEVPLNKTSKVLEYNIVDDVNRNYIAPMTNRCVRLSGYCEIGSAYPNKNMNLNIDKLSKEILNQAKSLLPDGYLIEFSDIANSNKNLDTIKVHTCWRPQTPDDLPVIGRSKSISNMYYNTGHGHLGLTRIVGSSKLLSNYICTGETRMHSEKNDNIDIRHFDVNRFENIVQSRSTSQYILKIVCQFFK